MVLANKEHFVQAAYLSLRKMLQNIPRVIYLLLKLLKVQTRNWRYEFPSISNKLYYILLRIHSWKKNIQASKGLTSEKSCVTHVAVVRLFTNRCGNTMFDRIQNRRQKSGSRKAFRLCGVFTFVQGGGAWHSNLTKISLTYIVSYFNLGWFWSFVCEAKPTKAPPWRRDCESPIGKWDRFREIPESIAHSCNVSLRDWHAGYPW